jgi:hypothetical protein
MNRTESRQNGETQHWEQEVLGSMQLSDATCSRHVGVIWKNHIVISDEQQSMLKPMRKPRLILNDFNVRGFLVGRQNHAD